MNRKLLALTSSVLLISACGPSTFSLNVDLRHPSPSGLDLGGKSMSVVYMDNSDSADSLYSAGAADGFATALESGYFSGEHGIEVYSMRSDNTSNYAQKDTLVKLVMETGTDVVFLIDQTIKCDTLSIFVYDSMNPEDNVIRFRAANYHDLNSSYVGKRSAEKFMPSWKTELATLYYYDENTWISAAYCAIDMKWRMAMDEWMKCLDTTTIMKRACAEYNIAFACFMLGDYDLALEWLDASDADNKLDLSDELRDKINRYKK